jgi:hypothetical protein
MKTDKSPKLKITGPSVSVELDDGEKIDVDLRDWPDLWPRLDGSDLTKAIIVERGLEFPEQNIRIEYEDLKRQEMPWMPPRKMLSLMIIADWKIEAEFEDGRRQADVRDIPFTGAFVRISSDLAFFRTAHEDGLFPCWGDLTLDSDFLYKHSIPVEQCEEETPCTSPGESK